MAGPVEILIVVGTFVLIGTYVYIVSTFLREAEKPPTEPRAASPRSAATATASFGRHSVSAH